MIDHDLAARLHTLEMLEGLLADGYSVILSQDPGGGDYSGETWGRAQRTSPASTLEGCIEGLTDHPRTKVCLHCQQRKSLWAFGPDRDSADGRAGSCKPCEAKRIGAIGRRKKRDALRAMRRGG